MNSYPQQDVILEYNNTGITRYPVTFEYDREDQVVVRSWNELTNEYTGVLNRGTDYVFDGPTNIVFLVPVPDKFTIFRQTRINDSYGTSRHSRFQQGNAIRASDLNGNFELLRQAIQETQNGESDNSGDISDLTSRVNTIETTYVQSVTGSSPVVSSGGQTPSISMPAATTTAAGHMTAADKTELAALRTDVDAKVDTTTYTAGQAAQDTLIAAKVDTTTYNAGQAAQDAEIDALEQRLDNLPDIAAAFKGVLDFTDSTADPGNSNQNGDFYMNSTTGTWAWADLIGGGTPAVQEGDRAIWDATDADSANHGWRILTTTAPNLQQVTDVGNNTSNPITIGPDGGPAVTTLDADGSASFAGNIQTGGDAAGGSADGVRLDAVGSINVSRGNVGTNSMVFRGFTTSGSGPTSSIHADGSATFAGSVLSGSEPGNGAGAGAKFGSTGFITVTRDGANQSVLSAYTLGSADKTIEFLADGSATFEGAVTVRTPLADTDRNPALIFPGKNSGGSPQQRQIVSQHRIRTGGAYSYAYTGFQSFNNLGYWCLYGSRTSDTAIDDGAQIKLGLDGSAEFAGALQVAGSPLSTANFGTVIQANSNGTCIVAAQTADRRIFLGKEIGDDARKIELFGDGSATFAEEKIQLNADGTSVFNGQIQTNNLFKATKNVAYGFSGGTVPYAEIEPSIRAVFNNVNGNTLRSGAYISLNAKGTNNNYGGFLIGSIAVSNTANNLVILTRKNDSNSNVTEVFRLNAAGNLTISGNIDANNTFFKVDPDNEANYTTTTEEYEEQEELTPYIEAVPATYDEYGNELTAEVPAVEATYQTVTKTRDIRTYTGPTLDVKAAIQELQQRVADRDAVIASFATRLAQLEADHATLMGNNNGGY